jgi:hypothetical protein
VLLGSLGLGFISTANATVITFDNTAATLSYTSWDLTGNGVNNSPVWFQNGKYTESGLTIQATGSTSLFTIDYNYHVSRPSNNNTDFGYIREGGQSMSLSATNPFSIQSFNAAIFDSAGSSVTLNGFQGGTTAAFTEVFNTLGSNQWSLFNLTGWNNLTSVTITAAGNKFAFDNITINEAPAVSPNAVPEPESLAMMLLGLPMMAWTARRKKSV